MALRHSLTAKYNKPARAGRDDMCFELVVVLACTSKESREKKTVSTSKVLQTVLDVKQLIQQMFSVPVCVQEFTYESQCFADSTSLKSISLRSGDTVYISYPSDADCAAIDDIIAWLHHVVVCLRNETPSVQHTVSGQLGILMRTGISQRLLESLAQNYFGAFGETKPTVNRLYFMQANGICLLIELLMLIQRVPWPEQFYYIKYIELHCLQVLWSICETREFGDVVCKHNGLECCIKGLTHKVLKRDDCISDADSPQSQRADELLEGVMIAGLGTLRNLSEVTVSCRMKLASNPTILTQVLNISTARLLENQQSMFLEMTAAHMAATMLVCISFSSETHELLTNSDLINGIVHVCQMDRPWCTVNASDRAVMASYQTCMFLAQLVLISWRKIVPSQHQIISDFIETFMQKFTWKDIMDIDMKLGTTYETFLPFIRVFYTPDPDTISSLDARISGLRQTCLDVVILGLQATLGRSQNCKVVAKEGLLEYVTCIPFNVPDCLRAKAQMLVAMVSSCQNGVLQPPSLTSLSKAKLARMYFGLEQVLSASMRDIADRLL